MRAEGVVVFGAGPVVGVEVGLEFGARGEVGDGGEEFGAEGDEGDGGGVEGGV